MEPAGPSEYKHSYQTFQFDSALPNAREGTAGLTSMDLAISREPPLQGKGKSPSRWSRTPLYASATVNALLDPASGVGVSCSEAKRLKMEQFRKMRQLNNSLKLPLSEYSLQFGWKSESNPSPLLGADGRMQTQVNPRQEDQRKVVIRTDEDVKPEQGSPRNHRQVQPLITSEGGTLAARSLGKHNDKSKEQHPGHHHHHHHRHKHQHHHSKGHKKQTKKGRWRPVPLSTEYQQQFKVWPLSTSPDPSAGRIEGPSPASLPAAGAPPRLHSPSDPRLQRHSPIKMNLPKPVNVPKSTEYTTSFKSPLQSQYIKGAWLQPGQDAAKSDTPKDGDWLDQVQELKQKCTEYRARSNGSFFSRDYLDFLEQQQLSLLETASSRLSCTSSDICSTCDSAPVGSEDLRVHDVEGDLQPTTGDDDVGPSGGVGASTPSVHPRAPVPSLPLHRKPSSPPTASSPEAPRPTHLRQGSTQTAAVPGKLLNKSKTRAVNAVRPSTPDMKGREEHWGARHHLNLTTPCSGALFSPPKAQKPPNTVMKSYSVSPKYRRDMKSRAPIFPADAGHNRSYDDSSEAGNGDDGDSVGYYQGNRLGQTHTVSRPKASKHQQTTAAHQLRCDNDSCRELECSVCGAELNNPNSSQLKPHQKKHPSPKPKSSKVSRSLDLSGPHKSSASPTLQPQPRGREEREIPSDLESLSNLSASNCSIASSILQRARDRRDKFWNE